MRSKTAGSKAQRIEFRWHYTVHTSAETEWLWVIGRIFIVGVLVIAGRFFLSDNSGFQLLQILLGSILIYDSVIAALLLRGYVKWAFPVGLLLDNAAMAIAWWALIRGQSALGIGDDFYLFFFPILAIGSARLGWRMGSIIALAWFGWIAWNYVNYFGAGSYDVGQLPVRLFFLGGNTALFIALFSRLRRSHEESELIRERLEERDEELNNRVRAGEQQAKELDALNRFAQSQLESITDAPSYQAEYRD
ncbi:MAG: hypothetical protein V3S98_05365 [Dehalococcoidia bacterium]